MIGLFLLWWHLAAARALGALIFADIAGSGWQCTIRPPHAVGTRSRVNSWHAQGPTMGHALRACILQARTVGTDPSSKTAPKLGGEEFDA